MCDLLLFPEIQIKLGVESRGNLPFGEPWAKIIEIDTVDEVDRQFCLSTRTESTRNPSGAGCRTNGTFSAGTINNKNTTIY